MAKPKVCKRTILLEVAKIIGRTPHAGFTECIQSMRYSNVPNELFFDFLREHCGQMQQFKKTNKTKGPLPKPKGCKRIQGKSIQRKPPIQRRQVQQKPAEKKPVQQKPVQRKPVQRKPMRRKLHRKFDHKARCKRFQKIKPICVQKLKAMSYLKSLLQIKNIMHSFRCPRCGATPTQGHLGRVFANCADPLKKFEKIGEKQESVRPANETSPTSSVLKEKTPYLYWLPESNSQGKET